VLSQAESSGNPSNSSISRAVYILRSFFGGHDFSPVQFYVSVGGMDCFSGFCFSFSVFLDSFSGIGGRIYFGR